LSSALKHVFGLLIGLRACSQFTYSISCGTPSFYGFVAKPNGIVLVSRDYQSSSELKGLPIVGVEGITFRLCLSSPSPSLAAAQAFRLCLPSPSPALAAAQAFRLYLLSPSPALAAAQTFRLCLLSPSPASIDVLFRQALLSFSRCRRRSSGNVFWVMGNGLRRKMPCSGGNGLGMPSEGAAETGRRLANYCERFKVSFEYNTIETQNWEIVKIEDLKLQRNECLANLLDNTVVVNSPRDSVLKMIRDMKPDIFIQMFDIQKEIESLKALVVDFQEDKDMQAIACEELQQVLKEEQCVHNFLLKSLLPEKQYYKWILECNFHDMNKGVHGNQ
ncbi:Transcription factor GRAS, partial [Cynara cardunculus var. scolymus]